ncbi:hypothetical protein [Phytohabitans rumicis]|uniref:Uncharacterized protein n=1 Tax=Phytohabitans rumicis TaxID=1076125 RepID=A0A6V8KT63_9ACTN|nr:hypothetical protein [Phytohabitans rumicis]GFJ88312.1 hypothetical protein Prum_019540 [Phytohabitans rumicis]
MADADWARSDAWIFVSVVIGGGSGRHLRSPNTRRPEGVPLAEVLATAEHLHQSIPGRDEVETAIRRLLGAGLVSVTEGFFRLTPTGETLWRTRPRSGLSSTVDTMLGILNRSRQPGTATWSLSEDDYGAAVRSAFAP